MTNAILCISLTPLQRDARVLRQINLLASLGEVTTIGFGEKPSGATHHIQVPDGLTTLPQTISGVGKLAFRMHRAVEKQAPAQKWVLEHAPAGPWDLVVANDARVLDLAFALAGDSPVWADMHEWAPEERTHITSWRLLVAPFMTHLCRTYLPKASLVTTVSNGIVDLYREHFGVEAVLMTNAGPLKQIEPSPVQHDKIRCVHSGAAIHGRGLEQMIRVFNGLPEHFTLDLYLVSAGDGGAHLSALKALAAGNSRVVFHDPVAPHELPQTLAQYDVGVFWIPPTHTNARLTLPNKFFDYVQARLALAIGPSEEMVRELMTYRLGVVSRSFGDADITASMLELTPATVWQFKCASDRAAEPLSFEAQQEKIISELRPILTH